jgi:hypothetical protein
MSASTGGTGCFGRLVLLAGMVALAGLVWHSRQDRLERRLTTLGGEAVYTRGERAALLADRIQRTTKGRTSEAAPRVVDRLFGRIVAVHFGRTTDLRGSDPAALVQAIKAHPHLRTVLIDGVPLRDADLLRLVQEAPSLAELGLRNTEITEAGLAAARAKRPNLTILQLVDK